MCTLSLFKDTAYYTVDTSALWPRKVRNIHWGLRPSNSSKTFFSHILLAFSRYHQAEAKREYESAAHKSVESWEAFGVYPYYWITREARLGRPLECIPTLEYWITREVRLASPLECTPTTELQERWELDPQAVRLWVALGVYPCFCLIRAGRH